MASTSTKVDQAGGDQRENVLLSSIEDKHYDLIDERGDHGTLNRNVQDITKDLIAEESGRSVAQLDPQSTIQSTLSTIMSTGDNRDDDSKMKSRESSDGEMIVIGDGLFNLIMKSAIVATITKAVVSERCLQKMPVVRKQCRSRKKVLRFQDSNIQNKGSSIDDTVSEMPRIRKYNPIVNEGLPETVTILTSPEGGKLYLVGTAHFSIESQNDVSKVIQAVQPHIVAVELCRSRVGILQLDNEIMMSYAKDINYKTLMDFIKKEGFYDGLLHVLFLRTSAQVAMQLGMPPGGEFRRAFEEAKKVPNCIVHLADRPINVTLQRALRLFSWWQTIKLAWQLMTMKDPITPEDVELCKQRSMLDDMIASLTEEFPVLGEVFVKERDIYLTNSLQLACQAHCTFNHPSEPTRLVGIVGMGHTPGIIENWGKVKSTDIPPIMRVPPPSLSGKILKLTIKASVLGAVIYIGYKIVAVPATVTFQSLKSSVQGLLQVRAA